MTADLARRMAVVEETVLRNKFIPHWPWPKQYQFLLYGDEKEVLYGGAAGGGKSDAILMAALQYVHIPAYSALLLRRSYSSLVRADALMPRLAKWIYGKASWNGSRKQWTFPSGAVVEFGFLERDADTLQYQSAQYQFIGFDELTQFTGNQYLEMLSRLRGMADSAIPVRVRGATNPGGVGHSFFYERFVKGDRPFVPAKLIDNPAINREEYERTLQELPDIRKQQLLEGLWVLDSRGHPYDMEWWRGKNRYDATDPSITNRCVGRFLSYDTALKTGEHNAYTAMCCFEITPDFRLVLRDVWKERILGADVPDHVVRHAERWNRDGKLKGIIIEDASSGSTAIQTLCARGDWIAGKVIAFQPKGEKLHVRPIGPATWCKRGCVLLPNPSDAAPWLYDFECDIESWPDIEFHDVGDAFHQGVLYLENVIAKGWRGREGLDYVAEMDEAAKIESRVERVLRMERQAQGLGRDGTPYGINTRR